MLKRVILAVMLFAMAVHSAAGSDRKTFKALHAGAPITMPALPAGVTPRPFAFSRVVIRPPVGDAWAYIYGIEYESDGRPRLVDNLLNWQGGQIEGDRDAFAQVFDEEAKRAGFRSESSSTLFGSEDRAADFQVAVLIDKLQGLFCINCPNWISPNSAATTVLMAAHWEVYSNLDRKVIARIDTDGGAETKVRPAGSVMPGVLSGFRENVRMLLASPEFRSVVTGAGLAASAPSLDPVVFRAGPTAKRPLASSLEGVAAVLTGDGFGSGFLISSDGYLLTNHHVVGGAKFVKIRWSDQKEAVGEVLRSDRRRDIALIKVDAAGRKPLGLRASGAALGETVFAIGMPLEEKLQGTVTRGIVSANRSLDGQPFIQSDAAINHGNSGGPLLDENGTVLGVADLFIGPDDKPVGLNFFIPIDEALKALALKPAP